MTSKAVRCVTISNQKDIMCRSPDFVDFLTVIFGDFGKLTPPHHFTEVHTNDFLHAKTHAPRPCSAQIVGPIQSIQRRSNTPEKDNSQWRLQDFFKVGGP